MLQLCAHNNNNNNTGYTMHLATVSRCSHINYMFKLMFTKLTSQHEHDLHYHLVKRTAGIGSDAV